MLITKKYEQMINIGCDIIGKLSINPLSDILMDMLKSKYEGSCLNDGLIISIDSIEKRSKISINKNETSGEGVLSLIFVAKSIVYNQDDVIVNARVLRINERSILIADTDKTEIRILSDNRFIGLSKDDIIMVKVRNPLYTTGNKKITIIANIYLPQIEKKEYAAYHTDLDDDKITVLNNLINDIEEIKNELRSVDKNITGFFSRIFYPFNELKNVSNTKNILDIVKEYLDGNADDLYLQTSPEINILKGEVVVVPELEGISISKDKFLILAELLVQYKTHLKMVKDLAEQFPTQEAINTNKKVWNLYNKNTKLKS